VKILPALSLPFPFFLFLAPVARPPTEVFLMKKHFLHAIAAAVLVSTVPAAAFGQNVAIVNGQPIPKTRMEQLARQLVPAGRPVTPDVQNQLREEVIAREIFTQAAQKQGLESSADYKGQLELMRQVILIRMLFDNFNKNNPIPDADARAEYDRFVAANESKEYKVRHILVETEDQANKILADLKKGAKFEDLAKAQSKDPGSGANGGSLDWVAPQGLVAEFSQAMVKLNKGETTTAPVKSQFGFHIIRVEDIRPKQMPGFEELKPQIVQQLQQARLQKYQEELRAKAKVE
jgi:peptidyl-prolyl cis-trans isomerase C